MKFLNIPLLFVIIFSSCSKEHSKEEKTENTSIYNHAYDLKEVGQIDSAFLYFNKAKEFSLAKKDSLSIAKCLINMAIISTDKGDYFGGEELSLNALDYINKKNSQHFVYLRSNFNNLGLAAENLKDYDKSIAFYQQSIAYATDNNDVLIIRNNIANVNREKRDYKTAITLYIDILKHYSNGNHYARVLSNLAFTKWLANQNYNAVPVLEQALNIRLKENDLLGQNASYSHLADYYSAQQPEKALHFAGKMYDVAKRNKRPDDQLEALQKLIKLSPPKETKHFFGIYTNLDDSLQNARSSAKNQFALIRYETEKHKADFLNAQAENIEQQNEILLRNIGLGILFLISVSGYFWFRKRRELLKQEKELEVKNTELKYVKKVHDRVANKVYHVMSEVENTKHLDKENLLDKLEVLYNISRNISYENKDVNEEENFAKQLHLMLKSYSSEMVEIHVEGNQESIWKDISSGVKSEVFYVLQEFMTNMKKHSHATFVNFSFEKKENQINILYTDNGIGVSGSMQLNNGLKNTGNRIEYIRGEITFDTTVEKGLRIFIAFPIS